MPNDCSLPSMAQHMVSSRCSPNETIVQLPSFCTFHRTENHYALDGLMNAPAPVLMLETAFPGQKGIKRGSVTREKDEFFPSSDRQCQKGSDSFPSGPRHR